MPLFLQEVLDLTCQTATQHLRRWTKPDNHDLVLNAAMELTRSKPELVLENMLVRQQLIVLRRQVRRPALTGRDRMLFVLLASKLRSWKQAVLAENAHPFENCVHYPRRAKYIIPGNLGQLSRPGDAVTSQSYLYGKLLQYSWVSVRLSPHGNSTGIEVLLSDVTNWPPRQQLSWGRTPHWAEPLASRIKNVPIARGARNAYGRKRDAPNRLTLPPSVHPR